MALLASERILCIVYKLNSDPHSDYKKTQTLFFPSEQRNQGSKNLQELNNPVKTIKMRTYAITRTGGGGGGGGGGCHINANVRI